MLIILMMVEEIVPWLSMVERAWEVFGEEDEREVVVVVVRVATWERVVVVHTFELVMVVVEEVERIVMDQFDHDHLEMEQLVWMEGEGEGVGRC